MKMHRSVPVVVVLSVILLMLIPPSAAGVEVYAAMGIDKGLVLSGTQATAQVLPDAEKEVVCLVAYFVGKKAKPNGIRLKLAVLQTHDDALRVVWEKDFSAEYGADVGEGDLQLFDLDRDGLSEIVVSFDMFSDPLIRQRLGEVIVWEDDGFKTGWSGEFKYDATKAVRDVAEERRDSFIRELDLGRTLRTRGVTLFFSKTMIAVAGEKLAEPKVIEETFPLRKRTDL